MIERERLFVPPPHVLVHAVNADQADVAQCTGQGPSLQASVSPSAPHTAPPCAAATVTARVRVRVPALHESEQSPHESQGVVVQSTGHACTLHARDSDSIGHAAPPKLTGWSTARERVCEPEPQDSEHASHASHVPTTQSTGQE